MAERGELKSGTRVKCIASGTFAGLLGEVVGSVDNQAGRIYVKLDQSVHGQRGHYIHIEYLEVVSEPASPIDVAADYDWKLDAIERWERSKQEERLSLLRTKGEKLAAMLADYELVAVPYVNKEGELRATVDGVTFTLGNYSVSSAIRIVKTCLHCRGDIFSRNITDWVKLGRALSSEGYWDERAHYCTGELTPAQQLVNALEAFIESEA